LDAHGFALIDLVFVCGIIGVLAATAMPRMLLARQAAGASSAIGAMRAINSAQLSYAFTCGLGFYAPSLSALGTAPEGTGEAFISRSLGASDTVLQAGYKIQMTATGVAGAPESCNGVAGGEGGHGFKAGADPTEPGNLRFFATNANVQIYEHVTTLYAGMPEVGPSPAGDVLK
jgi:type II secretory pathway pseudopilin PulG